MPIRNFKIEIPNEALEDLSLRLRKTKWANQIPEIGWSRGTDKDYLQVLVDYWISDYDWRTQEKVFNQYPQYKCNIDGVDIHFFHIKGKGENPLPLILTHGWPDSFVRYQKIISRLTDPISFGEDLSDSFDVIIPSLPGIGFSSILEPKGFNNSQVADLWVKLMTEKLGYTKFGAAGGDVGSGVTRYLAMRYPEHLIGIHLTDVGIIRQIMMSDDNKLSSEEKEYKRKAQQWIVQEGGYMSIQSTKPQTLSYALSDSPVGLAAWIVEKFYSWSDISKGFENKYSMDGLLNNVMIYWLNNSIGASAMMYYENMHTLPPIGKITTPTGIALFAKDILLPPEVWVEDNLNLVQWSEIPRGGHFTAMEEPELYSNDICKFYRSLR
ncbi:MAG: epoxide hydrolase [Prevotella sp.]|jgi:pimeloyl-ACP methyl ester carboxylesterase|nr:epoxide hydrolase [Prevotella sp.]